MFFKVYTSIFSFFDLKITRSSLGQYNVQFLSSMKCSGVTSATIVPNVGFFPFTCQSNSLVYGDILIKIVKLSSAEFSSCLTSDNSTGTPVDINTTNITPINITVSISYKPLEAFKTTYPLPQVFHLRHRITFDTSSITGTLALQQPVLVYEALSESSYNCPLHCSYCTDSYYPNGRCIACDTVTSIHKNFNLENDVTCTCRVNNSKSLNYTLASFTPDDTKYDLTLAENAPILADYNAVKDILASSSFFKYSCSPLSLFNTTSSCFNTAINFFDPRYLMVSVSTTTTILRYSLMLNNTLDKTISSQCASQISTDTFLLAQVLGGIVL